MSLRRVAGGLLVLPLAATLAAGFVAGTRCDVDCGDQGRGYFILLLLCTPVAAIGVLMIGLRGLPSKLTATVVALCVLLLAGVAVAATVDGVRKLTTEPQTHTIGLTEPSEAERTQTREDGIAMLVLGGVLGLMALGGVLALGRTVRVRRR